MSTTTVQAPTTATATAGISLRAVSKRYGEHLALAPLDLDIREGEFFCLLGPSGCGKTTTLNLIGGFVEPTSGQIHIQGKQVDQTPPHKRDVNTVFQSYALFPHLSVHDNVAFGLRMAGVAKHEVAERVPEALRLVGLEEKATNLPSELSGGQQQRVAVARALVNRPAVLLLDEPLGALDLKLRKRLQVELSQIHKNVGTTFVLVTHDQEEAMAMADRVAVMCDGELEQVGTPEEIYRRPESRFVADFIGESNFLDVRRDGAGIVTRRGAAVAAADADGAWREATLMVRPECIAVVPCDGEAPAGAVRGRVLHSSFMGSSTRVAVDVGDEAPLVASVAGGGTAPQFAAGADVAISWEPKDAVLLDRRG